MVMLSEVVVQKEKERGWLSVKERKRAEEGCGGGG